MNNPFYICHYCIDYKTQLLGDMIKHYKRKNKCQCNTLFSYENAYILSKKKYIFNFNIQNLTRDDYLYIITHYLDDYNIINKNYKNIFNEQKNILLKNYNIPMYNNNNIKKICENIKFNLFENIDDNNNENNKNNINNDDNNIDDNNNINDDNNIIDENIILYIPDNKTKIKYDNIYYNKKTKMFICGICKAEYSYLHNLKRHLEKNICVKRVEKNMLLDDVKKEMMNIIYKEQMNNSLNNTYINNNNIQNINNNNIQNINNNNNNSNNNTHNNTYNFSVKDFIHDRYDLSHITDEFYEQKDFFLYHNLLNVIMQNKNNQNIFFTDNEAIIYSDNELNKMSSDKAGYLILDKLNQSFNQLFHSQDKKTQEYYSFIIKYYHVVLGHYKHDTIFKDYDVNNRSFIYTSSSNMFRSRDKYLNKIISTVNRVKHNTLENMNLNLNQIKDIQVLNPNIADFASVRNRYRDLKN